MIEAFKNERVQLITMQEKLPVLPESKRRAIEEFVRILKEKYGDRVKKIVLYGSVARGDFEEDSDIDVLVVADGISLKEISKLTSQILLNTGEVISLVVRASRELERHRHYLFYRTVLEEGVVLE